MAVFLKSGIPSKGVMDLLAFRSKVEAALCHVGKSTAKRGRLSSPDWVDWEYN